MSVLGLQLISDIGHVAGVPSTVPSGTAAAGGPRFQWWMGLIIALVVVLLLSAALLAALLFRRRRRQKQVDQVQFSQPFLNVPSSCSLTPFAPVVEGGMHPAPEALML